MDQIGNIRSSHRANAMLSVILLLLGGLFFAAGLLPLVVLDHAQPENRSYILRVGLTVVAIGLGAITGGILLRRSRVFTLGERGLRVSSAKRTDVYLFADIVETAQMFKAGGSVALAFRTEGQTQWEWATVHLGGYTQFRRAFIKSYIEARLPVLRDALEKNQHLIFKTTAAEGALQLPMSGGFDHYVKAAANDLTFSREALVVDGQIVPLSSIVKIRYDKWPQLIVFSTKDKGDVGVSFLTLFEPELFMALAEQTLKMTFA